MHFRKRIGVEGVEKIFSHSVTLHGSWAKSKMLLSDTTVQGNNTTANLAKRMIDKRYTIAANKGIQHRQSYMRVSKQLLRDTTIHPIQKVESKLEKHNKN